MDPHRFLNVATPLLLSPPGALAADDRPYILRLVDLEKTYDIGTQRETKALRGINLEISLGEIVIIFGPSGSGKSTLLNILAGLDSPTGGTAEVDGKNLMTMRAKDLAEYHQHKVGMVFQSYNLIPTFTVMQNITMPARLAGYSRAQYEARGRELMKTFQLEELAQKLPEECSGGQQQRVGIMRAFMNRPTFIIADEPTGNLDTANTGRIMQLFKQLNQETNTTMLIVTHDPTLFSIADRVVQVLDGKVVKQIILTARAKIDVSKVKEPVEFRYRDADALMEELGGSRLKEAEAEDEEARKKKSQQQVQQVQRMLGQEQRRMEAAWQTSRTKEIQQQQAKEEKLAAALQAVEDKQEQLILEEQALAIAFHRFTTGEQLQAERSRLAAEAVRLAEREAKLKAAQQVLAEEKKVAEREMQSRLAVASNIVEHEKEQLETQRQQQEEESRERAQAMERKLMAAGKIISYEKARLVVEYDLIAQEKNRLEDERRAIITAKQQLTKPQPRPVAKPPRESLASSGPTPLEKLLAQRDEFSAAAQYILGALATLLSPEQGSRLARQQILRIIEGIEYRLYNIFNQNELQAWLDRPLARGGAGLYRPTAEKLAADIENLILLGRFSLPTGQAGLPKT